jgi:FtsH-binding integral membrane protein
MLLAEASYYNFEGFFAFIGLIFLLMFNIFLYMKYRFLPLILLTTLISLIAAPISIETTNFPLNPYFQIFFILAQVLILYSTVRDFRGIDK